MSLKLGLKKVIIQLEFFKKLHDHRLLLQLVLANFLLRFTQGAWHCFLAHNSIPISYTSANLFKGLVTLNCFNRGENFQIKRKNSFVLEPFPHKL